MEKKRNMFVSAVVLLILAVFVSSSSACHIGDFVWYDINCDGIQNPGEAGVPEVVVNVYNCDTGALAISGVTDANGMYLYGLTAGTYQVEFILPPGYAFSPQDQGPDDAVDSDADPQTGLTICTYIASDETDRTWDAGLCRITESPGTGTPGYWKNHPDAWPVEEIKIGDVTYTKDAAIAVMKTRPKKGDKTYTMFGALVAAKLNILIGNDASCIEDTVTEADAWMALYGPVGSVVKGRSDAWKEGEPLYEMLDDYNNGELCAPSRDD